MGRILLSIDGSDFVAYASLSSAKRAAKRAKHSARIVKEVPVDDMVRLETVFVWDSTDRT